MSATFEWDTDEAWLAGLAAAPAEIAGKPPLPLSRQRIVKRRHPAWRLGNSMEVWRATHRMTQSELADKVGVSRRTIGGIENGKHEPVLSLALAIAEVFQAPVEDIFSLHRPQFPRYRG